MSEPSDFRNRSQGYRWHAAIARDLAGHCQSDAARAALRDMARRYERLAAFAARADVPTGRGNATPSASKADPTWHVQ